MNLFNKTILLNFPYSQNLPAKKKGVNVFESIIQYVLQETDLHYKQEYDYALS